MQLTKPILSLHFKHSFQAMNHYKLLIISETTKKDVEEFKRWLI